MKKFTGILLAFFIYATVVAKTITPEAARAVAAGFFKQNAGAVVKSLSLAYTATSPAGEAVYFVYNNAGNGFVIVVADDALNPVIGYSTEGSFVVPEPNSNAAYWMERRKKEIIDNRVQQVKATAEISSRWAAYINIQPVAKRTAASVSPLIQTLWDQPYPYNALCPGGSVTGCVATTMAQIMKYWNYPAKGTSSSSYNSPYGNLSANYGTTTYNWSSMPTGQVTSSNTAVATLMYHCGVSVNMSYSPSGSGAYVTTYENGTVCAQISYAKYFGYDGGTIKGLQQFNYSDQEWINIIKNDLDAGRPVQYVGYDPAYGGHTWVCDGYDSYNYLHMNWGWGGKNNGYYSMNSLNPGGKYNFYDGHEVLVGIAPKATAAIDAGILSVIAPAGTACDLSITPTVRLENFGSVTLSQCVINYYVDAGSTHTYNWYGSLGQGQYVNVTLPAISVTSGTHSFTSYSSSPNNSTDGNTANNQSTGSFTIAANPPLLPVAEGFESSAFLPVGWSVWNPNDDAFWQLITTKAHTGTRCVGFNNCNGNDNSDMSGRKDRFITIPYDFTGKTTAGLAFDVAYAPCTYNGKLYSDTLAIYYSIDCGSTWTQCYIKGGTALATAPTYNANTPGCWSPTSTQWRTDTIDLTGLTNRQSVMLAFENRSGWGEWIYLDNVNISGSTITGLPFFAGDESFSIYPNPATSNLTIEGPGSKGKIHYSLYNIVGEELKAGDIASGEHGFTQTIPVGDVSQGMYFLRISSNERSWTAKVEVR